MSTGNTLTNGVGVFGVSLRTAGNQTLTATDTSNGNLTGTSAAITVSAAAANHFAVSAPATAITGKAMSFTVTAEDPFNNTAANYTGTVHFTSSDGNALLPANATLTSGVGIFSVTLASPGNQTLTAADATNPTITGTSGTIVSRGLTVTSLMPTPTGFVATFDKPFNAAMLSLYDASSGGGIDDVLLTGPGATQTSFHGALIVSANDQTITFVKTSNFTGVGFNPSTGVLAAGTYTVTFRSAATGFVDSLGDPLDGVNSGNPAGSNYVATFVVAAPPVSVGIPAFARGPDGADPINLPNSATTGIPLNVSIGSGITSGQFTLQYNPALLSITAVAVDTSLTGATLSLDAASTAGTAILDFSSPTALTQTGALRLGGLVATVPNSAASLYKSQALLHWSGVTLNGGAVAAQGADSVEIVAYFGDAAGTANGNLSGADAADISAVATNIGTNSALGSVGGFSAFPLADPVIIADLNNDGLVDSADVTLLNSVLAGIPRAQIPVIPPGLTVVPITAAPVVTGVSLTSGSTIGGTTVIISGSGFTGATAVDFGTGNAALAVVVNSNTQITATSPPGAAGTVDVTVTTVNGTSQPSLGDRFTYAPIQFLISAPASTTAGTPLSFTVTALNASNNLNAGYSGTVHFAVSDGQATPPANATLTSGTGVFSISLKTAGIQTLTVSDTILSGIPAASATITVNAAAATHLAVNAPASVAAGLPAAVTVTAQDSYGNTASSYAGTIHFTSSDSAAVLPADSALTLGMGIFSVIFKASGSQTLTATDTKTSAIAGTSNAVAVSINAAAATHFLVSAPAAAWRAAFWFTP